MSPSSTNTRWCPTPEQLMILEELYRRGLRTPNASQIQKITAQLAFYGKIQGKNVFYWFQNHKARDRQKLRKKLAKQLHQQHLVFNQCPQLNINLDFHHAPNVPAFHQLLPSCYYPQNLHAQGAGFSEDGAGGLMRQTWRTDLPKDCFMRTYGHDSMMIMDVGPTSPPCCTSDKPPLQTLELFPLRSSKSTTTNDNNTKTIS